VTLLILDVILLILDSKRKNIQWSVERGSYDLVYNRKKNYVW